MSLRDLNNVRNRDDWYLGLIVRGQEEWSVPLIRHADRARLEFTMAPPFSMAEVHEAAVQHIEEWEAWVASEEPIVTKTGKVLTDADIEDLVQEAEEGYDVSHLPPADPARIEKVAQKFAAIVRGADKPDQAKIRRQLERADNPFAKRVMEILDNDE